MSDDSERIVGSFSRNISKIPMEISMEEAISMFPGFRFSPTDEELIEYYLKKKLIGSDKCVEVIPEVDICRHEPWDLPAQTIMQSDNEWFFFSPRGRKYPKGSQSKRATEFGYWKATGKERTVKSGSNLIGTKRTLVFHKGRAPKGQRTEWIMHEYCTSEKSQDAMVICRLRKNSEFHINENQGKCPENVQDDSSPLNNSATAPSEIDQSNLVEGIKMDESCSKESSGSYNSRSVEHIDDCGSESDEKETEIDQQNFHSNEKDWYDEEDWYADIMKDDIIMLDDSTLNTNTGLFPSVSVEPEGDVRYEQPSQATTATATTTTTTTATAIPSQGTANRRLRLRFPKRRVDNCEASNGKKESVSCSSKKSMLFLVRARLRWLALFVVMLVLLGLLVFFTRSYRVVVVVLDLNGTGILTGMGFFPQILKG